MNRRTKPSQHVDERIGAEEINTPAEEIADARLGHAECLGGSLLLEAASHDELLYLDHEFRPDQRRNPTSRNTFPVEGVIFSFIESTDLE